jgi:hypothetical protein
MYAHLPKNEKSFEVDIVGDDTFVKYKGEFTTKCVLNMSGKHALELEKTRLMADYANPSSGLRGIAITLSTIRAKIAKSPDWWTKLDQATEILDENVVLYIYDKCVQAEDEWRAKVKKQAEASKKEDEEEKEAKEKADKEESEGN